LPVGLFMLIKYFLSYNNPVLNGNDEEE